VSEPALALEHIVKRFGAVEALGDGSLSVAAGSIHALLGENGAGKTTLMRVAYGMEQPDAGVIRVGESVRRFASPADAIAAGIGMVHQHFTLVPAMTVAENVALGHGGRFEPATADERVSSLASATRLPIDPSARVRELPVSAQQRVELLKALSRDARILILDEPTAVLAPAESEELLRTIRQLAAGGRAIVLITHKLREAFAVADEITVLRRGRTTLAVEAADTTEPQLVAAMLGSDGVVSPVVADRATRARQTRVISARGIEVDDTRGVVKVRDASFDVFGGEIVGVAGVEGSGQRELLRAIAGRLPVAKGSLELPAAVGFVPDDRHGEALVLDMTLAENFALRGLGAQRGRVRWRELNTTTAAAMKRFDVRSIGPGVVARTLSGGNQQKFVLARELEGPPPALVVENPGRGLDVRASVEIRAQLIQASDVGVAVVAYSSDIDETLSIADRMLVVFAGTVAEVPLDREAVGRAMLGAS
jgi:ABC-type uncharacterized transport system ATPase subunit